MNLWIGVFKLLIMDFGYSKLTYSYVIVEEKIYRCLGCSFLMHQTLSGLGRDSYGIRARDVTKNAFGYWRGGALQTTASPHHILFSCSLMVLMC